MRKLIILALLVSSTFGCSSIVSKSEYAVTINSQPDSASFTVTNRAGQKIQSGVTPATVTLKASAGYFKGETYTVTLNKEGYAEKLFTVSSTLDGWYIGNILFGGLIGMLIVDPATGAMYTLPKNVDIAMEEKVADTNRRELKIATIGALSIDQVAQLKKISQ